MHQIGLIRALRATLVLSAALLAAAQLFAFANAADARGGARAGAAVGSTADLSALDRGGLGAVAFDGAASRLAEGERRAALLR